MTVLPPGPPPSTPLPAQPDGVAWPTRAWPEGRLGNDAQTALDACVDEAFDAGDDGPFGMTLALVVVTGGRIVAERYGPSASVDESLISWSMAKSITHALVGILVAEGRLDPAAAAPVPEWANDDRAAITLDQLLRMVPGVEFNEDYVDDATSHCIDMLFGAGADDMAHYTASLPAIARPDEVFNYSSGTTNVVCRILGDIVGRETSFEEWMRQVLLDPIGMSSSTLTFDGFGTWVGSSFLHTTAREFAKFGLLYLRDGVWDDRRILPTGWVDGARTLRARDEEGNGYGAHWWIWDHDRDVFAAQGYETQRILVDPGADTVVVRLGKTPIEKAPAVDAWLGRILQTLR